MKIFHSVFPVLLLLKIANATSTITNRDIVNEGLKTSIQLLNSTIDYLQELEESYATNSTFLEENRIQELLERTNVIFERLFNVLNNVLNHLEKSWSEPGKIIIECIRNEGNNARLELNKTITANGICINAQLPKIIDSYQSLLGASILTRDKIATAQMRLESCRLGDMCLILRTIPDLRRVAPQIVGMMQALPSLIEVLVEVFLIDRIGCLNENNGKITKTFSNILECALS